MQAIQNSELIITGDGCIYHLNLKPGDLATTIVTVGDPERVTSVSQHFDTILIKKQKREFVTHTGLLANKKISVCSTGMGTDNIDIFLNEVDALFNIDFETRTIKKQLTELTFIRIGTSGAIQPAFELDGTIISEYAIGFDTLMHFYDYEGERDLQDSLHQYITKNQLNIPFYTSKASKSLVDIFRALSEIGITITNPGFYGPQSRKIRLDTKYEHLMNTLQNFEWQGKTITNLEMETAGIYSLASQLGHKAISLNAMIANRATGAFSQQAQRTIDSLIEKTLQIIADKL